MASSPFLLVALISAVPAVLGRGFLGDPGHSRAELDVDTFQSEVNHSVDVALGCGGRVSAEDLASIEKELAPIWLSMPKISEGSIERRSLRYLVHRYFDRRSAFHIRGFEPSRPVNGSDWGDADILSQRVPAFVEAVLESKHKMQKGFNMRDVALVVATIQQLVFDSETVLLEQAYSAFRRPLELSLTLGEVRGLLETYLVHWLVGDDVTSIAMLLNNRTLLESAIPHWDLLVTMAEGQGRALQHRREQDPQSTLADKSGRPGHNALSAHFSFEDVHSIVGRITTSFASFWESECQSMKTALLEMDTHQTGRVPLSKFYSSALDSEWRFGESESYLRELGALDETSFRGKQVIIPNYIQGASNCIVSTAHYLVCCVNECEVLLGELEIAVGSSTAQPSQLLQLVVGMNSQTTLDDDFPPTLADALVKQLDEIGVANNGVVPLHGRLFAQWLHYAFPRECPFPHKAGSASVLTPSEFGEQYLAQGEEMRRHAVEVNMSDIHMSKDDLQWMSQWSPEEELISDQVIARGFRAPWERKGLLAKGAFIVLFGLVGLVIITRGKSGSTSCKSSSLAKSHLV